MSEMSFLEIVGVVGLLIGTVVALLRIIAPKTKTDLDDKALRVAEEVQDVVNRVSEKD
jgi:hypothetical protein